MLIYGLKVTLLGMGVVFVALILLMFLIKAQSFIIASLTKKEDPKIIEKIDKPETVPEREKQDEEDPDELIAVISAAIAALGYNVSIKTITRVSGSQGSAWSQAGRNDAINKRKF